MTQCSAPSLKNPAPKETQPGAVPKYRIERDILESIEKESPLHGIVARAKIKKGDWELVE
jgi:hypothetical protein